MNNNDDKDSFFSLYGVEENQNNMNNNQEIKTEPVNNTPIEILSPDNQNTSKPIPDEVMKEVNNNVSPAKQQNELLKIFIGHNYEKFISGGFSIPTFLFGPYYLYYRKQYTYVLPLIVFQLIISIVYVFVPGSLATILSLVNLVIYVFLAIGFKKQYVLYAEQKINELTSNKQNIDTEVIRKTGGVNAKAFLVAILVSVINITVTLVSTHLYTKVNSSDFVVHFPEAFNKYANINNTSSYKIGKYTYNDLVINVRDDNNVCNYKVSVNDEYINKDKDMIAKKYLKDKHSINAELKEVEYSNNNYLYYYNEEEKTDYYIHITDKYFTEIEVRYVKDNNKKCHEYTEYILNNSNDTK